MPQRVSGNIREPLQWSVVNYNGLPGTNPQAIKAGATGIVHVCTGIIIDIWDDGGAAAGAFWNLLDGATPLLGGVLGTDAQGGRDHVHLTGLNLKGTAGSLMQLGLLNSPSAATYVGVSLIGYEL